jgi:hypothetical protein
LGNHIVTPPARETIDGYIERALQLATSSAFDEIFTKSQRWAKTFAYFLGIPGAMLVVVLSVLGVQGVRQVQESVTHVRELQTQIADCLTKAQQAATNAETIGGNLSQRNQEAGDQTRTLTALQSLAQHQIETTKSLQSRTMAAENRVKEAAEQVRLFVANQRFRVFVQLQVVEGQAGAFATFFDERREELAARGLTIRREDIARLHVDRSEVVYYDDRARKSAEELAKVFATTIRTAPQPGDRPFDVLLKLRWP